jgi:hypothetical protein
MPCRFVSHLNATYAELFDVTANSASASPCSSAPVVALTLVRSRLCADARARLR